MNKIEIIHEIETIVEAPRGSLKGDEVLSDINWDSMAIVMFLAMADEKLGMALDAKHVASATTITDLVATIES